MLRNLYDAFDANRDGWIQLDEFLFAMQSVAQAVSEFVDPTGVVTVEAQFRAADKNGDGVLSFNEFAEHMYSMLAATGRNWLDLRPQVQWCIGEMARLRAQPAQAKALPAAAALQDPPSPAPDPRKSQQGASPPPPPRAPPPTAAANASLGVAIAAGATMEAAAGADGDGDLDVDLALQAVGAIAGFAEAFPMLGPIGSLLRGIVEGAMQANYNRTAASLLALRCRDVALALADVLPMAQGASASLDSELSRLKKLLGEADAFMVRFKKRSYLGQMLKGSNDARALEKIDKGITDVIQSMSLSLGAAQMRMQQRSFDQVAKVSELIEARGGATAIKADPEALAEVARAARVPVEELQGEMQTFFQEQRAAASRIESKLDSIMNKMDGPEDDAPSTEKLAAFWDQYFDAKIVPFPEFLPVFEEEFHSGEELTKEQARVFELCLDAYPQDGKVSLIEWKRFQKKWTETGLGFTHFIETLAANSVPGS